MTTEKNTLKQWFSNGKRPTGEQFSAWLDSYRHNDDIIPIEAIEDIQKILSGKADTNQIAELQKKLEGKASADALQELEEYLYALIDDSISSTTTTYSSTKIDQLMDEVKPSQLIEDELEESSVYTYSIDKIRELIQDKTNIEGEDPLIIYNKAINN